VPVLYTIFFGIPHGGEPEPAVAEVAA